MTETISQLPDLIASPPPGATWNPAMRPEEDTADASVTAIESVPASTAEPPSQSEEPFIEDEASKDILPDVNNLSKDENSSVIFLDSEHTDPVASLNETTEILPEETKAPEINWGEETGTEWNIQSQDPFEREDIAGRTNSFPPVNIATETVDEESLSSQQNDTSNVHDDLETSQKEPTPLIPSSNISQSEDNFWDEATAEDNEEGEFLDQYKIQTKPIYMPQEAESRYEEGVPLVERELDSEVNTSEQDKPQLNNVFEDDDADDFFASAATKGPSMPDKPVVTRKSTSDVLSSLNTDIPDPEVEDFTSPKVETEEDLAARWQAELDNDDDLLIEDDILEAPDQEQPARLNGDLTAESIPQHPASLIGNQSNYANPYTPHQPSSSELLQGISNNYTSTSGLAASPFSAPQIQETQPRVQSYVDQAREGYKSPYDLPEVLARPRAARRIASPPSSTAVPPSPLQTNSIPTSISHPPVNSIPPPTNISQTAGSTAPVQSNFFEELPPPAPKPRTANRTGPYTPVASNPPISSQPALSSSIPPPLPPVQITPNSSFQNELQVPERVGPYANLAVPPSSTGPGVGPRYSPKPPNISTASKSPSLPRYSPAPPSRSSSTNRSRYVSQPTSLPFQPRTSSPLAYHEKTAYEAQQSQQRPSTSSGSSPLANPTLSSHTRGSSSVPTTQLAADAGSQLASGTQASIPPFTTPANPYAPEYTSESHRRVSTESSYLPGTSIAQSNILSPPNDIGFPPPRRSQTQSPGKQLFGPNLVRTAIETVQRPASVHVPSSPTKAINSYVRETPELNFIPPTDGRELDPLQRWKGAPVFKFAFGGVVSSCFPQHIPRYAAGQMNPMIQPAPGEAKVRQFKHILPSDGDIVVYPGPLKTKSKKKDVIAWLSSRIAALENEGVPPTLQLELDGYKRHDERILLWKLLRILVENDGVLEGNKDVENSLRNILLPNLESAGQDQTFDSLNSSGVYQPTDGTMSSEPISSNILKLIKVDLLSGNRDKAVWRAVDNRLWGHAMVISSALDKALWKQVVQEFVRREVRSTGENIESLAALYAIVSGNTEESIDELVPPSARLGLQMVSKEGQGVAKNAADGLDRWRETLGLILSNRSPDDHQALCTMGQLLSTYGRTEASHVCYLFARVFSQRPIFGGADDPQASVVLLGTDHQRFPTSFFRDEDAIALTEVYEFATSILAGNAAAALPYLQSYKLQHAYILADNGMKSEALQYCEAIGSVLKANTKPSPYYHQRLFIEIDELATTLKQAPGDGNSSWMSKPSMEKVSGSMWARFSSFVAGDESDSGSNGPSVDTDVGPFAKVTEAATISRPPSVSDIYGSHPVSQPPSNAFSRYAPPSQYATNASPEQYRGRNSVESQRSPPITVNSNQRRGSQEPVTPMESSPYNFGSNMYGSPSSYPYHSTPPQSSYVPLAPVEEDLVTQPQQSYPVVPQQSALTNGLQASPEKFGQPLDEVKDAFANTEVPHYGGYEPPSMSSYEPPSYEPGSTYATDGPGQEGDDDDEQKETEEKTKKKSFMDDDDDDLTARAAAIQKAEKARNDREADDAFRKAAEADAQRPASPRKGWFGSWWGGKKEGESSGGPIRAKLGEENSFYYDPELKKWVNKKDPNSAAASVRATPPPPKGPGPQSRSVSFGSTASGPPVLQRPPSVSQIATAPDSRPSTGAGASPLGASPVLGSAMNGPLSNGSGSSSAGPNGLAPRSVSTTVTEGSTGPGSGPAMAPPRPSTASLSNANSIDDLLGAPTARKGGSVKSKKRGRGYVDVMAK